MSRAMKKRVTVLTKASRDLTDRPAQSLSSRLRVAVVRSEKLAEEAGDS
jgi:hypothetical protein